MDGELEFWRDMFGGYEAWRITEAFRVHLLQSKFFPRPAEIRELIDAQIDSETPMIGPGEKLRRQLQGR